MSKIFKKIIGFLCSVVFCTIIAIGVPQMARAAETENFTGASGKSGALEWNITAEGHLTVTGEGDYEPISIQWYGNTIMVPKWIQYYEYISTAKINVKNITSARNMFYGCSNLTSLDLSNFNTTNVTNMVGMFYNCRLTSLDLSNFDTSNVTDMERMFSGCSLTSLDLSNFDTSNVTNMRGMFYICSHLTSLDLSNFNTSNVTDMVAMFSDCRNLTSLDLSNFDTSNVTNMRDMFSNCSNLTSLDLSNFNTSNVTSMSYMFRACSNLTSLDLSNFDTSNVTSMSYMFSHCSNLTSLDLSNFNTSNVTNMSGMLSGCSSLTSLDLSNFNTSNVTNMSGMLSGCSSLTSLDLSNFDTSNVTDMVCMFSNCRNLTSLNLSNFNTSNVTSMEGMFSGCSHLTSLDLSNFNTNNITSYSFLLEVLPALEKLYFFANASIEYTLPSSADYRWINEDNETCTKTAKLDRKMTYTRVDKDYVPPITPTPSPSPVVPSDAHIFIDYNYSNPVTDNEAVIYGNGANLTIDGKKVNNKVFTAYTDILASYKYTLNSKGIVKPSIGKVIVGVTKSDAKPEVNSKNKITDTSASKIAKAKIKNGQITVTAVGKESGLVYLWVIDTGSKGVSACCPIDVKLAPTKLEVQNTSGSKLTKNTKLENGKTLDVCVAGLVGSAKTEDCTYTATVDLKYQSYITVTPVQGSTNKFTINAKGLKNNKDTKVTITFKCDQNGKKTNLSLTISN